MGKKNTKFYCRTLDSPKVTLKNPFTQGGSPGLVVMGGDSCLRGCEFESRHHKLDGIIFFHVHLL